jgi:peptide-methionine (R)-S-oxide reductase
MKHQNDMPEEEWQKKLTAEQYKVLREGGTEAAFTGKYNYSEEDGIFRCAACNNALFSSDNKFDSGTGWPSFDRPASADSITTEVDTSLGMQRIEVKCAKCGSHLGHVFDDGPTDTGKRYCINSVCLDLAEMPPKAA